MKRIVLVLALAGVCTALTHAQNKGFGVGIILGEPTGLSGKYWLSNRTAVDAGLAWSFVRGSSLHIHGDYLWHIFDALKAEDETIPLYVGLGGRLKFGDRDNGRFGVRVVGGIDFMVYTVPLDIFLEIAPIMDLVPATQLGLNGGIGARFFFE